MLYEVITPLARSGGPGSARPATAPRGTANAAASRYRPTITDPTAACASACRSTVHHAGRHPRQRGAHGCADSLCGRITSYNVCYTKLLRFTSFYCILWIRFNDRLQFLLAYHVPPHGSCGGLVTHDQYGGHPLDFWCRSYNFV